MGSYRDKCDDKCKEDDHKIVIKADKVIIRAKKIIVKEQEHKKPHCNENVWLNESAGVGNCGCRKQENKT